MARYAIRAESITTSASANTYITIASLRFDNTTGHRGWLRRLVVGGAGVAAQDVQVNLKVLRSDNTGNGTAGASILANIQKMDPNSIASRIAVAGKTYSAEPTTYESVLGVGGSFNARGTLVLEWGPGEFQWGSNQALGVLAAPGAATATTLSLSLEWDE